MNRRNQVLSLSDVSAKHPLGASAVNGSDLDATIVRLEEEIKKLERIRELKKQVLILTVAAVYSVKPEELASRKRTQPIADARQVVFYLMRQQFDGLASQSVAESFNRDRSTVDWACHSVQAKRATDSTFAEKLAAVEARLAQWRWP